MLGCLLYADIISITVFSSSEAFIQFPRDEGFFPEDISTMFMSFSLKISPSSFSLPMSSPSFSILIKSSEIKPLLVQKGLTVPQNLLFVIIPFLVASLKYIFFAFLVNELQMFLDFLWDT